MSLTRDNDVVQTLAPGRSDNSFGKAILPGRGWCNRFVPNAHCSQSACDNGAVDPIVVPDHITGSPIPRKCLGDLACNPVCTENLTKPPLPKLGRPSKGSLGCENIK